MKKIVSPLDNAWFVDQSSTVGTAWIDSTETKWKITGPREIIIKKKPYSNEDFATYSENGICECGQTLDKSWRYCPKCGGKLVWD